MKTTVNSTELAAALRLVGTRIPLHSDGVHFRAEGATLTLTAGDLSASGQVTLPATVQHSGAAVLPGRELKQLARTLPADVDIDISNETEDDRAVLTLGPTKISLPLYDVKYPMPPTAPTPTATLPGRELATAAQQVVKAAGKDETLPILTGIRLKLSGDRLELSATDRYRFAHREVKVTRTDRRRPHAVDVSGKAFASAANALRHAPAVSLALPTRDGQPITIGIPDGSTVLHTMPLQPEGWGPLPGFDSVRPPQFTTTVTAPVRELTDAVARIDRIGLPFVPIVFQADPETGLHLTSGGADTPQFADTVGGCRLSGKPDMRVALAPHLLLGALTAVRQNKGTTVQISFAAPDKPVLVHEVGAEGTRYLIMPTRVGDPALP